jgi:hypothetical protein
MTTLENIKPKMIFSDSAINKLIPIVLTAMCHFIFVIPPVNAAYDPTPPKVTLCSVNSTTISENGGELKVTLHIVGPTPVDYAVINVMNSTGNSIAFGRLSLSSGTSNDGDWSGNFSVRPNLKPGLYSVVAQNVMDTSQNSITFYYCPNLTINYGNFNSSTPTPTPAAVPTPTPTAAVPTPTPTAAVPTPTPTAAVPTPTPTPTPTAAVPTPTPKVLKSTTIKCIKGKLTKKVSGKNPKCPGGYKKA